MHRNVSRLPIIVSVSCCCYSQRWNIFQEIRKSHFAWTTSSKRRLMMILSDFKCSCQSQILNTLRFFGFVNLVPCRCQLYLWIWNIFFKENSKNHTKTTFWTAAVRCIFGFGTLFQRKTPKNPKKSTFWTVAVSCIFGFGKKNIKKITKIKLFGLPLLGASLDL